ncbi:MAG: 2-oxoacid:acceptor oxidoreductase family protein [Candidatus Izemoplasmatales bacterium]|jgi:2-oxoglutarate ferredoxin oxidoreductase subunit gamma
MGKAKTIRVAGFGGQGVMMFGQLLAYSATHDNLNCLWFPSYGPETRGGTANCSVIISEAVINSPVFKNADHLIAFNGPSMEKFQSRMAHSGLILYNASLIKEAQSIPDVLVIGIPVNDIATELGSVQVANMVMLGCYLELTHLFTMETIETILKKFLGERKAHMLDLNLQAIAAGREYIKKKGVTYA